MALSVKAAADRKAIFARLEIIVKSLGLSYTEAEIAAKNDQALIDFCERHNQSMDWIVLGNPGVMISLLKDGAKSRGRNCSRAIHG
jgi:hypothetical protein